MGAKVFAAFFSRGLDDLTLIVSGIQIKGLTNGVQRDDWSP